MFKRLFVLAILTAATAAGCASDPSDPVDGPPEGYTRYRSAPITVPPGESGLWAQWLSAPMDRDLDVVDVIGTQTAGGHHALMYSIPLEHEVGHTQDWDNTFQLSARFIGGIGGEGAGSVRLPPGVVFRMKAGTSLMVQTHYVNTTDEPITGEATLDVKFAEVSPDAKVASMFANATVHTEVAPGQSTAQVTCVLSRDIELLMFANHMHGAGVHVETREMKTDGTTVDIKIDPAWQYEWAFNPNFTNMTAEAPLVLSAGSTLVTDCAWDNQGGNLIDFPDEMCVFFGMFLGDGDVTCVDGSWLE